MPTSRRHLVVGSTESYSGKSATIVGIADQLQKKGLQVAYGKPLGACAEDVPSAMGTVLDADVQFIAQTLDLPAHFLQPTLLFLDASSIQQRLQESKPTNYPQLLTQQLQALPAAVDLVLLEGAGTLAEGQLFDLSLPQMAEVANAAVLLVCRFHPVSMVDALLSARQRLGDRLVGVLINDIPTDQMQLVAEVMQPFLERQGIPVLGMLPRNKLLRSVSVGELVHQLQAQVLCRPDRLDLMVESLTIGAMNVSAALKYFQRGSNMAVVTGGDRTDIQMAALETSTQCLVLTGQMPPAAFILSRAEELEIPVLSVELDTLSTVEIIDQAFGKVRLHETAKVDCVRQLIAKHFHLDRLLASLGIQPAAITP